MLPTEGRPASATLLSPLPQSPVSSTASPSTLVSAEYAGQLAAQSQPQPQPQAQPQPQPQAQGHEAIPDCILPGDMDDLLSGLGADDLDDFGDIDDADIVGDRSFESAPNEPYDHVPAPPLLEKVPAMAGFSTGSGRTLAPPSRAALDKARKIWAEDDDEAGNGNGAEEASSQYSHESRAKKPRLSDPSEQAPLIVGFQTGRGNKLPSPSRRAKEKAAKLFQDIDQEDTERDSKVGKEMEAGPSGAFGFSLASGKPAPPPSATSMAKVKHLFDDDDEIPSTPPPRPPSSSGFQLVSGKAAPQPNSASLARVKHLFDEVDNSPSSPSTSRTAPPISGFTTGSGKAAAPPNNASVAKVMHLFDDIDTNAATPSRPRPQPQPQPPARPSSPALTPRNPRDRAGFVLPSTPLRTPLATTTNTFSSMKKPINIKTPAGGVRRIGLGGGTPSSRNVKKGFTTPFKNASSGSAKIQDPGPSPRRPAVHYQPVFDLTPTSGRLNYKSAHLHPQYHSRRELEEIGIPDEIWAIDLNSAPMYRFFNNDNIALGHEHALTVLQEEGCSFVTAKWVENHWGQILWKLAGQILAKPDLFATKWSWEETINQLKYRYEREFGNAQRSIIKRIQEHDSSPSLPMILYVSAIRYSQGEDKEKCYLELSDGWYRIRAQIDDCLHRAVTKEKIVVGRKLAISGAKLESGSDGTEVFDALDKSHLVITGNSTCLARWYARLGIHSKPFVASLGKLTVDGGTVTLMEVVLDKVFPVAYTNGGKNVREAPWGEEEEQCRQDAWTERYASERSRLEDKMRKQLEKMEDIVSLLAQSAEETDPVNSEPPDSLESDFESLLEARDVNSRLRGMSSYQIVHLGSYANTRMREEMTECQSEIEAELHTLCPKRDIRDFRMVRFVDAQYGIREPARVGMLNVWDVKMLGESLQEGRRYLVSNLMPGRSGDWSLRRDRMDKAEVYLHTRRDTRWQMIS